MRQLEDILRSEFEFGPCQPPAPPFTSGWERWQGRSFVRSGSDLVRTAGEDDAIMVLRFGKSAMVDLHARLLATSDPATTGSGCLRITPLLFDYTSPVQRGIPGFGARRPVIPGRTDG